MQVLRWGDELAIRLPEIVVEALNLKEGDEIDIAVAGERENSLSEELLRRLKQYEDRLPSDFKFGPRRNE